THAHPIGLSGAIAHDEVTQLPFGRFDGVVDLAYGRLEDLGDLGHDRPLRDALDRLINDAQRLPHLLHANQVSVVSIAVCAYRNVEIEVLVRRVGLRFAQVPFHAAGAQHRSGDSQRHAVAGRDHAYALGALHPDAVGGQQLFVFVDLRLHVPGELLHVSFEAI